MSSQVRGKLNRLLTSWPAGTVVTTVELERLGISRQLAERYVRSGWVERLGPGAFVRPGGGVGWRGGLYALQAQLGMTAHVGARTALELQGRSHFVALGTRKLILLVSDRPEHLPAWFRGRDWDVHLKHSCLTLFSEIPARSLVSLDCGTFQVSMSSPERATLEEIRLATSNDDIRQVQQLVEGLDALRPDLTQELLERCRSAKVKRLFLWAAESAGHAWFGRLDTSRIDLGKGKRQVYKDGKFSRKYQITVPPPEDLPGV